MVFILPLLVATAWAIKAREFRTSALPAGKSELAGPRLRDPQIPQHVGGRRDRRPDALGGVRRSADYAHRDDHSQAPHRRDLTDLERLARRHELCRARPERPFFGAALTREIPYYAERHWARPGITGWAQINYGASTEDRNWIQQLGGQPGAAVWSYASDGAWLTVPLSHRKEIVGFLGMSARIV